MRYCNTLLFPKIFQIKQLLVGMCVDGGGNLCICDFRNNRVTLLTAEGKLIGHSLTGLSKPQQIALNHNTMFTLDMGRSTSYR